MTATDGASAYTSRITAFSAGHLPASTIDQFGVADAYDGARPLLSQARRVQGSGTVAQSFAYDPYARLISERTTGADGFIADIQYGYDAWGGVSMVSYPGASSGSAGRQAHYEYDSKRRLRSVRLGSATAPPLAAFTYDQLGRKQDTLFGSGAANSYTYGPIDRISRWQVRPSGQAAVTRDFAYDAYGYLSSTGEWSIANDALGRIQSASGYGIATAHGHDAFGNATSHSAAPAPPAMISWAFPPMAGNRVPAETLSGAQTWWQYSGNGEAAWVGRGPGGGYLQMEWDALGQLKAVSDGGALHAFDYAPSGLRVRDRRQGQPPSDRRFAYSASGALMSVFDGASRRDVVYANGGAIAEVDQDGGVFELHLDHLGTPRYITSGASGHVAGEQAFGPYGEQVAGAFSGAALPWGYRPLTGWTGHLNEDATGLIYMKGRYYSPLWHRFVNSDQGMDPMGPNQYAYAGGMPFMAKDPSGMQGVPFGGSMSVTIHADDAWGDYWRMMLWMRRHSLASALMGRDMSEPDWP